MKLTSPQPNQMFWHVGPEGRTYTSDEHRVITPPTPADSAALLVLGCEESATDPVGEPIAGHPSAVSDDP